MCRDKQLARKRLSAEKLKEKIVTARSSGSGVGGPSIPPPLPGTAGDAVARDDVGDEDLGAGDAPAVASPQAQVEAALEGGALGAQMQDAGFRDRILAWVGEVDEPDADQRARMLDVFRAAPDDDAEIRQEVFKTVYKCEIDITSNDPRGGEGVAPMLTKIMETVEGLPGAKLPKKWSITGFADYAGAGGFWDEEAQIATINYGLDDVPGFDHANDYAGAGDPLEGTKMFESVVSHELGHAICTQTPGAEAKAIECGGWEELGAQIGDVIPKLAGAVASFATDLQRRLGMDSIDLATVTELVGGQQRSSYKDKKYPNSLAGSFVRKFGHANMDILNDVSAQERTKIVKEAVGWDHDLFKILVQGSQKNPSLTFDSEPVSHGGKVYMYTGAGGWFSFSLDAWKNKMSKYQFAAPGEWFAEYYVAAANQDANVRKLAKQKCPEAHSWMVGQRIIERDR